MRHRSLEALQTRRLIADIRRVVEILNVDIAEEEADSGVSDPTRPEYPMLARALLARRDNLVNTLSSLEARAVEAEDLSSSPRRRLLQHPSISMQDGEELAIESSS
jgi:hypothetical protein